MIKTKCISSIHRFIFVLVFFLPVILQGQQSLSDIRLLPLGSVVTTSGILTSGPEFGQIRYMQDADAGIALYSSSLSSTKAGDSILVTGVLSRYKGELQLAPIITFQIIASGINVNNLKFENLKDISHPAFESRKIMIPCLGIASCESELEEGWYSVFDQWANQARLKIAGDHPSVGFPIQDMPFSVEGIWTKIGDQYQLICQQILNAAEGSCHYISPGIYTSIEFGTPVLKWSNVPLANTRVEIKVDGDTVVTDFGLREGDIQVFVDFLHPHKIYEARLCQENASGNYCSVQIHFAVSSSNNFPIEVLFNRSINASFSDGSSPIATGPSAIESDVIQRIDQSEYTLDVAMYNTTRDPIVEALTRAVQRGVKVRYIADDETSNTALEDPLSFPVLFRAGDGIMHNKFIIADVADTSKAWVWTGSTNWSTNQLATDPNHAFIIHDRAFALNYLREFEEMWGDSTHNIARSGDLKTDNTIHQFELGDVVLESFFSPSDETNCHIIEALRSADHHIEVGLLLFTKQDLVDELIILHQKEVDIRLIIEDETSSSLALSRLNQAGVSTAIHDLSSIFHHKYAIVDEGYEDSDPLVITGSHNWTWSADNINDENTLIVHDQSFANIFRQEFEARWDELEPTSTSSVSSGNEFIINPNPAKDFIDLINQKDQKCIVALIDINGAVISTYSLFPNQTFKANLNSNIADGLYLLHWKWQTDFAISRFAIQN